MAFSTTPYPIDIADFISRCDDKPRNQRRNKSATTRTRIARTRLTEKPIVFLSDYDTGQSCTQGRDMTHLWKQSQQKLKYYGMDGIAITITSDYVPSDWKTEDFSQFATKVADIPKVKTSENEADFNQLVSEWRKETGGSSMMMRRYAHPSYQSILVLGGREPNVIKWILRELQIRPDMWFEALRRLTNEDPAKNLKTFDGAVKAWLDWGKKKQLIF